MLYMHGPSEPAALPAPTVQGALGFKTEFRDYATMVHAMVHGVRPHDPRRSTGNRKAIEDDTVDETDWIMAPKHSPRGRAGIDACADSANSPAGA
jgi:hypothetical protein